MADESEELEQPQGSQEAEHWLDKITLLRIPGMGPVRYAQLRTIFSSDQAILEAPINQLCKILGEPARTYLRELKQQPSDNTLRAQAEADLSWLKENNAHLLDMESELYPELLKEIEPAPPLLYVQGSVELLSLPQIAIVGARNATPRGLENAHQFAKHLARMGFAITSGLALGVDAAAHQGALVAEGKTIAVIANGLDKVYPRQHQALAQAIIDGGGAIVSEYPIGTAPARENFPRRNRIISGLSLGVLVAEAAVKSGSLITARYALEQNREVFAIPGSIHNALSRGCHALIKQGAQLVESTDDMVDALSGYLAFKQEEKIRAKKVLPPLTEQQKRVMKYMDDAAQNFDVLAERCQLDPASLSRILMQLELQGLVEQDAAGAYLLAGIEAL